MIRRTAPIFDFTGKIPKRPAAWPGGYSLSSRRYAYEQSLVKHAESRAKVAATTTQQAKDHWGRAALFRGRILDDFGPDADSRHKVALDYAMRRAGYFGPYRQKDW